MNVLWHNWLRRSLFIVAISIFLSWLLSLMGEYQITVESINTLSKTSESMTTNSIGSPLFAFLPWVKTAVFIGLPMLLLIVIRSKKREK